jgi:hypothetical protein
MIVSSSATRILPAIEAVCLLGAEADRTISRGREAATRGTG